MNYHIEKNTNKTAYLQLYEQLKNDVTSGIYPYGSKLPSKENEFLQRKPDSVLSL